MSADHYVHPTAIVEDGVTIGAGTSIWHHCHIRNGAVIGAGCVFGKNVFVDAGVRIGSRVKVQNNVSVYAGVTLGDEVFVGPSAVFTNDTFPRAVSPGWQIVETSVERGASIGANATIICGSTIGSYAMIGAGSVVTRSVDAHQLVVGNPARQRGWVCQCGEIVARGLGEPPAADVVCTHCGNPWRSVDG